MLDLFRLEVESGSGGYSILDEVDDLLFDVEEEFGEEMRNEVALWAADSTEGDIFEKDGLCITNIGKDRIM